MVLVVDDVADIRAAMVALLTFEGYEAHASESGEAGLAFIEARRPHCVILDLGMPVMDGFEVLRRIRSEPAYADVRVIVYSAFDGELRDRALRLGADDFVQKGTLDWSKMIDVLRRFCKSGAGGRPELPARTRPTQDVG